MAKKREPQNTQIKNKENPKKKGTGENCIETGNCNV